MSNSKRQLPDVSHDINQLTTDVQELKNKQFLGGDGWIMYRNVVDGSNWDVDGVVLTGSNATRYRVTFTPDSPDKLATASLVLYFHFTAGGGLAAMLPVANSDTEFWVRIEASGSGVTYGLKFIVQSTQSGSVSFAVA